MKKIFNDIFHYFKLLIWKYFPPARPKRFVLKGRLSFDFKTKIFIDSKSEVNISGDFNCISSNFTLIDSIFTSGKMVLNHSSVFFYESELLCGSSNHWKFTNLLIKNSKWTAGHHCRLHYLSMNVEKTTINLNDYFLAQGLSSQFINWNFNKSAFSAKDNCRLQGTVSLDSSSLNIGSNVFINTGTQISSINSVVIGDYVLISYDCLILDNNSHHVNYKFRRAEIDNGFPNSTKQTDVEKPHSSPVFIGNDIWIGARCIILKGVSLKDRVIVAAGTTVTKDAKTEMIVYGWPNKYKSI
jgi:acetyltransferase-like isoleucine patch superfamily enzyme